MDATNKQFSDGFLSQAGGMHSGLDPLVLSPDNGVYHVGVNVTARDGTIQTRPSFVSFASLPTGRFQGGAVWKLDGVDRFVFVTDGVLYSLRFDNLLLTSHGARFSTIVPRCTFCQAYKWMVIQDGSSQPQALEEGSDGEATLYTRTPTYVDSDSPPAQLCLTPGTVMAYAHGRIHYVPSQLAAMAPAITDESDPTQINATPTILEPSGKAGFASTDPLDIYVPEFVFRMTEHRALNTGGQIELPAELGNVYGMAPIRNSASGTGTGPLVVFGREGVSAFDVSIQREEWKNVNIGQVLFSTVGTVSPYSVVQMNSDIGFLDTEGRLRSIKFEGSSAANTLTSLPMSHELEVFHSADTLEQLPYASASFFDSRLLFTLKGSEGPIFDGLASLDFAKLYSMGQSSGASFDGVWTGFDFQQVLAARDEDREWQQFAVVKSANDGNLLLRLSDTAVKDLNSSAVESILVTRYMDFGAAIDTKVLKYCELWLSDIAVDSDVSVYFRPRGVPGWTLAATKSFNIPSGSLPQARRRVVFPVSLSDGPCDPVTGEQMNLATHMQFALVWTGRLKIDRFRAVAALRTDPEASCLDEDNPDGEIYEVGNTGVELDYFRYKAVT